MSVADQIRQAIAPAHVAVEQTPFAQGMASGRITRTDYIAGLQQIAGLHEGMEAALIAAQASAAVAAFFAPETMCRGPVVRRDIAALGGIDDCETHPTISTLIEQFDAWTSAKPHALLGALYVMEGSRMGSMVLARSLSKGLQLEPRPGTGLDYHIEGIATRPTDWKKFRESLANWPWTETETAEIVHAATLTMDALVELYAAVPTTPPVMAMA
ncbi:MAG: biliverdin-producing heme oxygenase [Fimbriiglobus sp.]